MSENFKQRGDRTQDFMEYFMLIVTLKLRQQKLVEKSVSD